MNKQTISPFFLRRIQMGYEEMLRLLESVIEAFDLGEAIYIKGIEEGYEDMNIEVRTNKGRFLVKILVNYLTKSPRSREDSEYYAHVIKEFTRGGIRVPKLYRTHLGDELYEVEMNGETLRAIVMEFFEGHHFLEIPPTLKDMKNIAGILAKLHSLDLNLRDNVYDDPWQPQFLKIHYSTHGEIFTPHERQLFERVINNLDNVDFSKYAKTPCHGDLMRNNIMKNDEGEYCLLDFGVVTLNYWIIDLSLYMAGFCLSPELDSYANIGIFREVAESYGKHILSSASFYDDLHTLVHASYASFYLASTIEKIVEKNLSDENQYWIELGKKGMQMMEKSKTSFRT